MFLYFYLMFLMFLFFFINMFINNVIYWWSVFLLMTLIYMLLCKYYLNYISMINYFIIQEVLGLLFLIFSGLIFQLFVLMIKVGMAPFHFWIFSIVYNLDNYMMMWFLTFQKLPFLPVILLLFNFVLVYMVLLGLLFCYLQIYSLKNFKLMFILSSTESFNWILLGLFYGIFGFFFIIFYYFINMFFFIIFFNNFSYMNLETVLVFLNIPVGVLFFVKVFMLYVSFFMFNFFIFFMLFLMFLSSLSFIYWMMVQGMFSNMVYKNTYLSLYFLVYFMSVMFFF